MKFQSTGYKGEPQEYYIDQNLSKNLDNAIIRVKKKNWDYVGIVSGLPGSGKSTLAKTIAKYFDPNFSEKNIAFSDEEFINLTNNVPEHSAVILDESFASLNTKIALSGEFLRIVNHLQLIRQKHLFIILCLPNFFDLSKGIAIFRASHLFVVYDEQGDRGRFLVFDREAKRKLYVLGSKFMNYSAAKANFHGRFTINSKIVDEKIYEARKRQHLLEQDKNPRKKVRRDERNEIMYRLSIEKHWKVLELTEFFHMTERNVQIILAKCRVMAENEGVNSKVTIREI